MKKILIFVLLLTLSGCELTQTYSDSPSSTIDIPEQKTNVKEEIIKIGSITPLDEKSMNLGQETVNGIELAAEKINDEDFLAGKKIVMVHENGGCDRETSRDAAIKMMKEHDIIAMIGGICYQETMGLIDALEYKKIPIITPFSTSQETRVSPNWVSHINHSDADLADKTANVITNMLGQENIVILHDNSDVNLQYTDYFREKYEYLGGAITADLEIKNDEKSIEDALVEYITTTLKTILVAADQETNELVLNKIGTYDKETVIFSTDVFDDKYDFSRIPDNIVLYFISAYKNEDYVWHDFATNYHLKYDKIPGFSAAEGYDALFLLATALKETTDPQKMVGILRNIKDYKGASGPIEFNSYGENIGRHWQLWNYQKKELRLITDL